ncbi:MAG TPA: MarC family protein [Candidatus Acidoferrales bacterium]|jgi:multiple antibiotic resistance protein|nr:MarC family protein [Candidatus Acidoferrales bacterium]
MQGPSLALHAQLSALLSMSEIFTLLFITLGPLKALGPFVKATQGADAALIRRIAFAAFAFSTISLFAGVYIGQTILDKWNVGLPALMLTAGALLFFVAFRSLVVDLYSGAPATPAETATPSLLTAISPLTFPVIATPYGIAILILLKGALPEEQVGILLCLGGIMVLNLLAMLFARQILRFAAMPLQLVGTILTVLQAALGVQILIGGFRALAG